MEFNNKHIESAFQLISSLNVSGKAVDVVWATKQHLLMADKDCVTPDLTKEVNENG